MHRSFFRLTSDNIGNAVPEKLYIFFLFTLNQWFDKRVSCKNLGTEGEGARPDRFCPFFDTYLASFPQIRI